MERFAVALKYVRIHILFNKGNEKKIGMSLRELSDFSGVSSPYISRLEQIDSTITPSLQTIGKLAMGLATNNSNGLRDVTIDQFLRQMAGYESPDPRTALKVVKGLSNVNFKNFLQGVVGYMGTVNLDDPDDEAVAESAFKNWDAAQLQADEDLIRDYQEIEKSRLFLSKVDDPKVDIILDNKPLSPAERIVLTATIKTIRELRKNNIDLSPKWG